MRTDGLGSMRRLPLVAAASLLAGTGGCADGKADTDTSLSCPLDLGSYCAYEFGGECPTWEEAAAMTCNRNHFEPSGQTPDASRAYDGSDSCPFPSVVCGPDDDRSLRTILYFDSTGPGALLWASLHWDADPECSMSLTLGEPEPPC